MCTCFIVRILRRVAYFGEPSPSSDDGVGRRATVVRVQTTRGGVTRGGSEFCINTQLLCLYT